MRIKCIIMWVILLVLMATGVMAAPEDNIKPDDLMHNDGHVVLDWDRFKEVTNWDKRAAAVDDDDFVIPWNEVRDLFDIKVEGVDAAELKLPWKEFKTLLEWSIKQKEQGEDNGAKPPVPWLITSAQYEASDVSRDGALFTATFKIEILDADGWKHIPILPGNVAARDAKLPDGAHLQLMNNQYEILVKEQKTGSLEVRVDFSVAVRESAGRTTLNFPKMPSGTSVVDILIPEQDLNVTVPAAQSKLVKEVDGGTRIAVAIPATMPIDIAWERAIPEAEKVPPKLFSETRTLLSIAEGLLIGQTQVSMSVLHTPTRVMDFRVPEGVSILEVTGLNIRDWRMRDNILHVQFSQDVLGSMTLNIQYEKPTTDLKAPNALPVVTAEGVQREKGYIGIAALTNVEVESAGIKNAHQIEVKDLPAAILGMTTQPVLIGYRYVMPDFDIALNIGKHEGVDMLMTVIDTATMTYMQTFDGQRIVRVQCNVRNSRNQFLRVHMPEKSQVWSVTVNGRNSQPAKDDSGAVLIPLVRSGGAMSAFPVEIVYVEEGNPPDDDGRGVARVDLPRFAVPITHLKVALHVPEEGKYWDFEGSLRKVEQFTPLGGVSYRVEVQPAPDMQQEAVQKVQAAIRNSGASAMEIRLPVMGETYLFEKILVLDEPQYFTYHFKGLED